MKKIIITVLLVVALATCCVIFAACHSVKSQVTTDGLEQQQLATYNTYVAYAEELGIPAMSYEEWLNTLRGADGIGIKGMTVNGNDIWILYSDGREEKIGTIDVSAKISMCEHSYGAWRVGLEPTCTSIGYKYRTCAVCGVKDYDFLPATGHTYAPGMTISAAGSPGTKATIYTCEVCGAISMEPVRYSEGLDYEAVEVEDAYRVVGAGTCTDTEIIIPEEHDGKPVTEIGDRAFFQCDFVISIILPKTVEKIGDKAFSECENLENVEMSDEVETGVDVFRGSINVEIQIKHSLEYVPAKEATCLESGNIAYYYCPICDMYYEDAEGENRLYNVLIPPAHDFVDGQCLKCGAYEDYILITETDSVPYLGKFPLGTLENAIGLPGEINVRTRDGVSHVLPVMWDLSTYKKAVAGEYTIKGYIQASGYHFADGVLAEISTGIEIVEYMKGTADIVFVLDISGSMGDEIANVKNNIEAFSQAIEDRGVSARWSAITFSDFTCSSEANEISTIRKNGASDWFITAETYKSEIAAISLAYGGDEPEADVDGLMLANTLEKRKDARVFYILLTDATYKVDNNYDVASMEEAVGILNESGVNISVITSTSLYSTYQLLTTTTGGILSNITDNFSQDLIDNLVPIIYNEVMD